MQKYIEIGKFGKNLCCVFFEIFLKTCSYNELVLGTFVIIQTFLSTLDIICFFYMYFNLYLNVQQLYIPTYQYYKLYGISRTPHSYMHKTYMEGKTKTNSATKRNSGNFRSCIDVTTGLSPVSLLARFCTPPEVKFSRF